MATSIQSTNLDFDRIKNSLKSYLKSKSEFSDYDFEASGLSNILDVLAYNTHFNGLISNFALNEALSEFKKCAGEDTYHYSVMSNSFLSLALQ